MVLAQQTRVAMDDPKPWPIQAMTWAAADFLMIAESQAAHRSTRDGRQIEDRQGVLTGRIILLQQHSGRQQRRRNRVVGRMRRLISRFNTSNRLETLLGKVEHTITAARLTNDGGDPGLVFPEAQFALYRSGEFRLRMVQDTLPTSFEDASGQRVSEADVPAMRDAFATDLSKHFYYFVRDLSHRHYHHDSDSDALLQLHPANAADDTTWRRETLYALGRAVLEARRDDDLLSYNRAKGISAYAKAFEDQLGARKRHPDDFEWQLVYDEGPFYHWEPLLASIAARSDQQAWRHSGRVQALGLIVSVLLATIALWFATAQIQNQLGFSLNIHTAQVANMRAIIAALYYQPARFFAVTVVITWVLFEFVGRGFRVFSTLERLTDRFLRFGYAVAGTATLLIRRNFPNVANRIGAYIGSALMGLITFLVLQLALALANYSPGSSILGKAIIYLLNWVGIHF
ncbi:MAG: hypothetical protein CGW95_05025 [Phenylobacterium zucineum]|nr:MAG: hypothetical protein CGW95_05025 [Phenylobacterium zucineum]